MLSLLFNWLQAGGTIVLSAPGNAVAAFPAPIVLGQHVVSAGGGSVYQRPRRSDHATPHAPSLMPLRRAVYVRLESGDAIATFPAPRVVAGVVVALGSAECVGSGEGFTIFAERRGFIVSPRPWMVAASADEFVGLVLDKDWKLKKVV